MYRSRNNQFNQRDRDDRNRVDDKIDQYNNISRQNYVIDRNFAKFSKRQFEDENYYFNTYVNQLQRYSLYNSTMYRNQSSNSFSNNAQRFMSSIEQRLIDDTQFMFQNQQNQQKSTNQQSEYDFKFNYQFVNVYRQKNNRMSLQQRNNYQNQRSMTYQNETKKSKNDEQQNENAKF